MIAAIFFVASFLFTPEWQSQARAITKEAVLALEEAKWSFPAETFKNRKQYSPFLLKMHKRERSKRFFPNYELCKYQKGKSRGCKLVCLTTRKGNLKVCHIKGPF